MSVNASTPWHKASFDHFLQDRLPALLADRLPLVGYQAESTGRYTCRVVLRLASGTGDVGMEYADLPQPDEDGLFEIAGEPYVVVPTASQEELDGATIRCAGEQLYDTIEQRLGQAPPDLPWDEELARAWLLLDTWIEEFLHETALRLGTTNWLSRHTHLRRIVIPSGDAHIKPGQRGRVCPFETPEGLNMGRVATIAVGAEIREGKLVIVDDRPEAGFGLSASMIPLLEHNDANRLLMGANMLRQWVVQSTPEPALVQTGLEPDAPDFWVGRNLLTAFVSWGADTVADGIVISESCARRFDTPHPLEPGDKLSNRYGTKGVVSRILPDDEMPHLSDGTPVELVFSFCGMHVRLNHGQVREALLGRIARLAATPIIAAPFHAPSQDELRQQLLQAGLPESGMEMLTLGRDGPELERPSTVGWAYWGRLFHIARDKLRVFVSGPRGQVQGAMENVALCKVGAYETVREALNTRASRQRDADTLAARVARGPIEQAAPPTPMFAELVGRLQVAGIQASLQADGEGGQRLTFCFVPPQGDVLKLARPVPHPWLHERELTEIGAYPFTREHDARTGGWIAAPPQLLAPQPALPADLYDSLVGANDRLARMLGSGAPERLVRDAQARLESRVRAFFDLLLTPEHLRFSERQLFSGRTVIAPGADLRIDQVGLADEIAWTLYGPLVARKLDGDESAVRARSERAARALEELMAGSWVIINRAPTLTPTALLAFHPVRDPDAVIRLHPLVCKMLDADFDGDQVAVFLPLTEATQREAGERLSVAGHLARDPGLLESLLPPPDALWGLANLGLTEGGRREIVQLAGVEVAAPKGLITRTTLAEAMQTVLDRDGIAALLVTLERLTRRGYEAVKASGASINPFIGSSLRRSPQPEGDDPELWQAYKEELAEQILSGTDYEDADLGPQRMMVNIRARGRRQLLALLGPWGVHEDAYGRPLVMRRNLVEGFTPDEMYAYAVGARQGLVRWWTRWEQSSHDVRDRRRPERFTVLARARQAVRPGVVFAWAAAHGEVDPLVDVDGRLLVGLPVS